MEIEYQNLLVEIKAILKGEVCSLKCIYKKSRKAKNELNILLKKPE